MNAAQQARQRVLIIDDTPVNLGVVVEALEHHGHRVLIAQDGDEGVSRARLVHPDLILLDVMMPRADGFEVCRRLKANAETADIPIIFMTALSDMADKVKGFQAGGVDYITKPFHLEEVLARVSIHLRLRDMQQQLAARNAELQNHREQLEQLVSERTEELRLRTLALNQVDEAAFLIDRDGRFIYVNKEAGRSLGYEADELLGMTVSDIDPDWPAERFERMWQQLRDTGGTTFETRHRRKDGSIFPVEITGSYLEYSGKAYNLALARDITERKVALEKLHASEQAFRALVENSPDAIARYDLACRRLYVNPAMVELCGRPEAELLANAPDQFSPVVEVQAFVAAIRQVIASKAEHVAEFLVRTAGGEPRWRHTRIVPEFGQHGDVVSVIVVGRDIHELKENEERFRTLTENIPDVVVRYDRTARRLYVNPAFTRFSKIEPEQALGKTPLEISVVPPEMAEDFTRRLLDAMNQEMPSDFDLSWIEGGRNVDVYVRVVPERDAQGRIVSALTIWSDISDRKDAERRLRDSYVMLQELASRRETAREEERKRIAREIHDELGQHLTALRMGVSTLRFQFGRTHPELAERVQGLIALADKTIQVVRDVSSALRPAVLDTGIASAIEWLAAEFERHSGVACCLQLPQGRLDIQDERAMALFRIVQESLTNVARHAGARKVDIMLEAHGDEYLLEIRDDGLGFAPGEVGKSSFGLIGMRERALMLGGEITVVSQPGRGTVVQARVPARDKEENR